MALHTACNICTSGVQQVTQYLEDVEDHLETYIEEISRSIGVSWNNISTWHHVACFSRLPQLEHPSLNTTREVCDSLRDQVRSFRDREQQGASRHSEVLTHFLMLH